MVSFKKVLNISGFKMSKMLNGQLQLKILFWGILTSSCVFFFLFLFGGQIKKINLKIESEIKSEIIVNQDKKNMKTKNNLNIKFLNSSHFCLILPLKT